MGNAVVENLGRAGIERIVVADPEVVEPKNLECSPLFRDVAGTVGRSKAVVVAEAMATRFPKTRLLALDREIADLGFADIAEAGILFGCVDSELARLEIAYIAAKLDLPVCDGGLGSPDAVRGRVSWYPGREAACYGCGLTASKRRELLTTWDSPVHPCAGPTDPPPRTATPEVAAVVGALQVETALRPPGEACSMEVRLTPERVVETVRLARAEACPFHVAEERLVDATAEKIGDLLAGAAALSEGEPVLLLDWPVCVDALCLECGRKWHPMRRVGWVRRRGACPHCGSRRVRDLETITRVAQDSVWAAAAFAELGLARNHLHTIRFEAQ